MEIQGELFTNRYVNQRNPKLSIREQPSYRVASTPGACTVTELLSVIIGGADPRTTAINLQEKFGTIQKISQAHVQELMTVKGISNSTALKLKASMELGRKILEPTENKKLIDSPEDAAEILNPYLLNRPQEYLMVILLDTRNKLIDVVEIYHGSLNAQMVRIAEVFRPAIQQNANGIIVAHNHPSGDPQPSSEDCTLTRALIQTGKTLDIEVLDHVVIGSVGHFVSMKERGLAF